MNKLKILLAIPIVFSWFIFFYHILGSGWNYYSNTIIAVILSYCMTYLVLFKDAKGGLDE